MGEELRIYYECFEQARHFIEPIFIENFPNLKIKLIRLPKGQNYGGSSLISKVLRLKNPDILVSILKDNEEIPLFVFEFSEAVITEDHELQRFDGYLAAVAGRCIYIKLSPLKKSPSNHGGNTKFNFLEPYALLLKKYSTLSFHFELATDERGYTKRDPNYFSCPVKNKELEFLLSTSLRDVLNDFKKLKARGLSGVIFPDLKKDRFFGQWIKELKSEKFKSNGELLKSTRLEWLKQQKAFVFKFNRMGHAMDPERGMIWYYRARFNQPIIARIVFPSTGDKVFNFVKLSADLKYLFAFTVGMGLDSIGEFTKFIDDRFIKNKKLISRELDISDFIKENFDNLNKPLLAIIVNAREFLIQDNNKTTIIRLFWKGVPDLFLQKYNLTPLTLSERQSAEEDDVTYVMVHNVLRPNNFKMVSVSYPGAQGDRAILPQAGTGRKQSRTYIDIISYLPGVCINLNESKGAFSLSEFNADVDKLALFRSDKTFKAALNNFITRTDKKNKDLPIILSVSFWTANSKVNLGLLPLEKINFFVEISGNIKKWRLWSAGDAAKDFKIKEGNIDLPKTFYIKKISHSK